MTAIPDLVDIDWLRDRLGDPGLVVVDASIALGGLSDLGIPGAVRFDLDGPMSRHDTAGSHDMPAPADFERELRALGIREGDRVVAYDAAGIFSSARAWWMLRTFGAHDVAILDGGFAKWQAEGHPVEDMPPILRDRHITVQRQAGLVRDVTQVAAASKLRDQQIVDARPPGRFAGIDPEPRPGLRAGHIPGARNVPAGTLYAADGTMKPVADLRAAFESAGVDLSRPVITTCGSGITAASLALALERIGKRDWSLYDGSWTEWGSYPDLKIETGDA